MPNRRMLNHTVVVYNYIGEINDVATYQPTVISQCCCPSVNGTTQGLKPNNTATLYVFDVNSKVTSPDGAVRRFIPYDEWLITPDAKKSKYWTLSDRGTDFFTKGRVVHSVRDDVADKFKIVSVQRFEAGSKRMWHWEVVGK